MFSRLRSLSLLFICLTAVAACSEAPARGGRGGSGGGNDTGSPLDTSTEGSGGDAGSDDSGATEADAGSGADAEDTDPADTADAGSGDTSDTGCTPACEAGQTRCAGAEVVERCVADADGCAQWTADPACAAGARCEAGACVEACTDECATGGLGECDGGGVRLCGNFDGDSCLEFSPTEPCPTGTSCSTGFCSSTCTDECLASGNLDCSGDRVVVCGQFDADSCLDLSTETLCVAGESCTAGACVTNNVPPIAVAGADLTGEVNRDISLDGSTSYDPDGDLLFYAWTILLSPDAGTFGIVPTDGPRPVFRTNEPGTYRIGLTVTDTGGLSTSDTLDIVVTRPVVNLPPVAVAGADQTVTLNTALRLDGSASSDPESTALSYRWTIVSQPSGAGLSVSCATANCGVTFATAGSFVFRLTVTDGGGLTATDDITITVSSAPCLLFSEYVDGVSNNKAFELYNCGTGTVDLADFTVCLFTNGSLLCTTAASFTGTLTAGDVFAVCNSAADSAVLPASRCDAYSPATNFNGDDRLVVFEDPLRDRRLDTGDNLLDAIGPIDGPLVPPLDAAASLQRCNLAPALAVGNWTYGDWFAPNALPNDFSNIGIPPVATACPSANRPPVAVGGADRDAYVGDLVTLDASGSYDLDGDTLSYRWTSVTAPAGYPLPTLSGTGATVSFSPSAAGSYQFSLTVTDGRGGSDAQFVTIRTTIFNSAPVAVAGGPAVAAPSTTVYLDAAGSYDPNGDLLTYSWSFDSLPSGSFASLSGTTSAYPTFYADVVGSYVVRLTVRDPAGLTSSDTITISVQTTSGCLRISEYLEGTSLNKAVELHNCDTPAGTLSGLYLCVIFNSNTTCGANIALSGTLSAGATTVICNSGLRTDASPFSLPAFCNANTGLLNFNGDDRLLLYRDTDLSGTFSVSDEVLDAFGETAVRPADVSSEPLGTLKSAWQDVTYRRCNGAAYTGTGTFLLENFYEVAALDDFSGFGIAPTYVGCP
jgi:hypothetical protein